MSKINKLYDANNHEIVVKRGKETNWHEPGFFGHAMHLDGTVACDGPFKIVTKAEEVA